MKLRKFMSLFSCLLVGGIASAGQAARHDIVVTNLAVRRSQSVISLALLFTAPNCGRWNPRCAEW
jgi:hypothetical protein